MPRSPTRLSTRFVGRTWIWRRANCDRLTTRPALGWCRCRTRRQGCSPPYPATRVFVGRKPSAHLTDLQHSWRQHAGLVRIHGLRHGLASRAPTLGESRPTIEKLLGHTQVRTAARYAHLAALPSRCPPSRSRTASAWIFWRMTRDRMRLEPLDPDGRTPSRCHSKHAIRE